MRVWDRKRGSQRVTDTKQHETDALRQLLHQYNQPLTAISNYAQAGRQLIDQGRHDPARLRELFEKIAQQSQRANALSHELGAELAQIKTRRASHE
jgi:two-component system sensor kinase FixL